MKLQISLADLEQFAESFWDEVGNARVFLFHGKMGAGKTTTIAALAKCKGVSEAVSSPTFSIIQEYSFKEKNETRSIFHIDLYRLKNEEEVVQAGVEDCVYSGAICFIEWPEKAPDLFDNEAVHVIIEVVDENVRNFQLLSAASFDARNVREQL